MCDLRTATNPLVKPLVRITESEEGTIALGEEIAQDLDSGSVVALIGELGSGKTRLVQGVCRGLGVREEVTSPSFVLINEYHGRLPVYHFDFYRIEDQTELWGLGCEEYFYGDGVSLIEWADRALPFLPKERVDVYLKIPFGAGQEHRREIVIEKHLPR